jgi:hypothetical protein
MQALPIVDINLWKLSTWITLWLVAVPILDDFVARSGGDECDLVGLSEGGYPIGPGDTIIRLVGYRSRLKWLCPKTARIDRAFSVS